MPDAAIQGPSQDLLFCTVCTRSVSHFEPGPGGRPNTVCPRCGALDRHRVMALVAKPSIAQAPAGSLVLDIAPAGALSGLMKAAAKGQYVSIDFDPTADGREVEARASVTHLPLRSNSVGFMLCSHVLEHVPDDTLAMTEIARVLAAGASALIQVPRRKGASTDEDLALTPSGRLERYGQADHVRLYGDDFESRLEQAGLRVASTSYSKLLPHPLLSMIGVFSDHELWVASSDGVPEDPIDSDEIMKSLGHALLTAAPGGQAAEVDRTAELKQQLEAAREESLMWKSNYEWLRNRPLVKTAASLKRTLLGPFRRGE